MRYRSKPYNIFYNNHISTNLHHTVLVTYLLLYRYNDFIVSSIQHYQKFSNKYSIGQIMLFHGFSKLWSCDMLELYFAQALLTAIAIIKYTENAIIICHLVLPG